MDLFARGNNALTVNPAFGVDDTLSVHGSDWLWAVEAIYIVAFLGMVTLAFTFPENQRVFLYTFTIGLLVGSVTYFAQAANLGWSAVRQADHAGSSITTGLVRQVFYARYINWTVSFPAVILALGLLSGVSWTTIACNIMQAWIWVLSYLAAAYTESSYRWGFFAFGTLCWLVLALSTLNECREEAERRGIARDYVLLAAWPNLLWALYPVAFGLSDGGNVIGVTGGAVFFGVLDALMLPVVGFAFVLLGRRWDWDRLELAVSEYRGSGQARIHAPVANKEQSGASSQPEGVAFAEL